MTDYPAAHSMDSTWFAVDADGEVAIFDTGEGGCIPEEEGFPMGGEAGGYGANALEDTGLLAHALLVRAKADERLRAVVGSDVARLEKRISDGDHWELIPALLRSVGIWTYGCDEPIATPYVREGTARDAIRVDDLDAELREQFANARLPVRFADAKQIAPGEFGPVGAWGDFWLDTKGKAHPTSTGDDFDAEVAQLEEDELEWDEEAVDGEIYEGEAFYSAVSRLLGASTSETSPSEDNGERRRWWDRLFRK